MISRYVTYKEELDDARYNISQGKKNLESMKKKLHDAKMAYNKCKKEYAKGDGLSDYYRDCMVSHTKAINYLESEIKLCKQTIAYNEKLAKEALDYIRGE